ncbi:hypothetical protein ACE3NQ_12335 [Paenibacillus terreus]|uniref:Mechanosensitive ion channel family protein n=1 Tax=Paenibacillus terreus TaxID=1387834 RepID=A0ABV5B7P1_9BACL
MILEWFTQLPDRLRWVDLLAAAGIMVLFLVFQRVFTRYLFSFLMKKIGEDRGVAKWAAAFEKPLQYIFLLVGAYLQSSIMSLNSGRGWAFLTGLCAV